MTNLLIKLFVKNADDVKNPDVRNRYAMLGSITGIVCNLLLFAVKITLGTLSGAVSVTADAFNNLSDTGSSAVSLLGFRLAKKPADDDHPFGHGRIEYISAFIVAILIFLVGFELLKSSVEKIFHPEAPEFGIITVIGLAVSIAVKLWMSFFSRKLGKKIDSSALKATAQDSLNDCISTGAVLISVIIMKIWGVNLDAYIGVAVALFILWSGVMSAKETLGPLLGEPPTEELISDIEKTVMCHEEFLGIHDLIVHNYGPGRQFASLHVEVPEDINILHCHEIIDKCELEIKAVTDVETVIHMDPICINDEQLNKTRSAVAKKLSEYNERITLHDFRMVVGEERTNLVFDVVIPPTLSGLSDGDVKELVKKCVKEVDEKYVPVIKIDHEYTGRSKK